MYLCLWLWFDSHFSCSWTEAVAELLLALEGAKDKSQHLVPALCSYPALSRLFTLAYSTFLVHFAKSQWAIPSTDCSSLSLPLRLSPSGSAHSFDCLKSLHSNATRQPFPPPQSGPTQAYWDLFGACLYPCSLSLAYGQTAECDLSPAR